MMKRVLLGYNGLPSNTRRKIVQKHCLLLNNAFPPHTVFNNFHSCLFNNSSSSSSPNGGEGLNRTTNYGNSPGRGGVLLKGTGVGATPTKPMKFKASSVAAPSEDKKKKEEEKDSSSEKAESRPKSKVLLNVVICFAVATGFLLQYTRYHEMIDESANDGSLKVLATLEEKEEKHTLYMNRHHFCMSDLVAISSNSLIVKVEEKDENLILVYNPTHLDEATKKNVDGLLSQSKSNTMVIVLPNHEHHKFFGDYFYEYVFKPSRDNSLVAPKLLFLCQKDAKEKFQEEARKNVIVRKEISVETVVNIDPELFMEFGRFSGVSKKQQAKDFRKPIVDLVARHFDIIRFRGLDTSVEEALLYHRKSNFIVSCDLMMNLKGNEKIDENNREKAIIRLRQPELEPYVIKYSRFFGFGDQLSIPFTDNKLFTDISQIQTSLDYITNLKWKGIVMAHGDPILINNEEEEKEMKEKWINTWKCKMENK